MPPVAVGSLLVDEQQMPNKPSMPYGLSSNEPIFRQGMDQLERGYPSFQEVVAEGARRVTAGQYGSGVSQGLVGRFALPHLAGGISAERAFLSPRPPITEPALLIPLGARLLAAEARTIIPSFVRGEVDAAFREGQDEVFEYGVESRLTRVLDSMTAEYGGLGVRAIGDVLASGAATDEVACEVLRHLGPMTDSQTRLDRLRILLQQLHHSTSPRRRYAAAVGLADMSVPDAIAALEMASRNDTNDDLRTRFRRLIDLLDR